MKKGGADALPFFNKMKGNNTMGVHCTLTIC